MLRFILQKRCNHNSHSFNDEGKKIKLATTQVLEFFLIKFLLTHEEAIKAFDNKTKQLIEEEIIDLNDEENVEMEEKNDFNNTCIISSNNSSFLGGEMDIDQEYHRIDNFSELEIIFEENFDCYEDFKSSKRVDCLDELWETFEAENITGNKRTRRYISH